VPLKGSYDESMSGVDRRFSRRNAPHCSIRGGHRTMMAAKGAIIPVGKVLADAGYVRSQGLYRPLSAYYTRPRPDADTR